MYNYNYPQRQKNIWKTLTLGLLALLCLVAFGYAVFSPYLSLWGMRNAALAKDGKAFASYIDFPVFKENLKAEFNAFMMAEMAKDQKLKDNPFAGLGAMLAPVLVNNLVDSLVTPAGVERLMNGDFIPKDSKIKSPASDSKNIFTDDNVTTSYTGLNEFQVEIKNADGRTSSLIFERHWIGDWKLAGIKMPR